MTFTYQYQIHVSDNKIGDKYNVSLYYYLTFILKRLRTLIRTFEAQITEKIRTSSLGEKKRCSYKKKRCSQNVLSGGFQVSKSKWEVWSIDDTSKSVGGSGGIPVELQAAALFIVPDRYNM